MKNLVKLYLLLLMGSNVFAQNKSAQETTQEIFALLQSGENKEYIGESVSQLDHALQCAKLASDANADDETILAALFRGKRK